MSNSYKLPSMEFTFEINKKGDSTKQDFKGQFTYKRLSIGDIGKSGVLRTRLNGDLENIDSATDSLHDWLSWLKYGLVTYPDWWRDSQFGLDLYDLNIIEEIWKQCDNFEARWTEKVNKEGNDESSKQNSI